MGTNLISTKASIGRNVKIGINVRIYDNVVVGDDSSIGDFCVLGHPTTGPLQDKPLSIGENSVIRSHSVLYEGSSFGNNLRVGHFSLLREGIAAGTDLQIGSYNDLEGDTTIGDWVRFHSNVHIGRGSSIGDFVWIFPNSVLTNDPIPPSGLKEGVTVAAGAVICTGAVALPNTTIGRGAFIAAMSRARGHIPGGALVVGSSGEVIGSIRKLHHKVTGKQHPWMSHFSNNYPQEAQNKLKKLHAQIENDINILETTSLPKK